MSENTVKRERWIVRDIGGVLHNAMVARYFDHEGGIVTVQVATACHPFISQVAVDKTSRGIYSGRHLPEIRHGGFMIVDWKVNEPPTCIRCLGGVAGFDAFGT